MKPAWRRVGELLRRTDPVWRSRLVAEARTLTDRYFGRAVSLYAPLYLADYCDNACVYCGFNCSRSMSRHLLDPEQQLREMDRIAAMGIRDILLLTGESRVHTPPSYLAQAIRLARERFLTVSLEVYPLEEDEYRGLVDLGLDGVTVYQETYNRERYALLHPRGRKADYDYRLHTPERAARAGVRTVSIGALLGLSPLEGDLEALYAHLDDLTHRFPETDFRLAFPRLLPVEGDDHGYCFVDDDTFVHVVALTRILFPWSGISISTREAADMRDRLLEVGVNRLSAGSHTEVGGYGENPDADPQFSIRDVRSPDEMIRVLRAKGFDPVHADWLPSGGGTEEGVLRDERGIHR